MRKPIIAANWKMNKVISEAEDFVNEVKDSLPSADKVEAVVCSPALFLSSIVELAKDTDLAIGAQTMHYAENGAYTGEISPVALSDVGVTHVIIGHSERREMFNEVDSDVNKKAHAAFKHNLLPIICVGESLEEREAGKTNDLVEKQVQAALEGLSPEQVKEVVIAYEPIWAIGTGKSSSAKDANEVCAHIRHVIGKQFSQALADEVRIQYGGSVNPDNIAEYMAEEDIDGALVGGASLAADSFKKLVEAAINE